MNLADLKKPLLFGALIVAAQAAMVALFAAPALHTAPRDLPIVVVGPARQTIVDRVNSAQPGAFEFIEADTVEEGDQAVRERRAYGVIIADPQHAAVHIASGASPSVAQLITGMSAGATVTDIVPADPDDPRGSGLISGFLPLLMTAIAAGAVLTLFVTSRRGRIVGVLGFSVLSGLAGAALLQFGFGMIGGSYLANAAAVGLLAAAISGIITGLGSLIGAPGIGVGALLGFVLGNPISALTSAPEMLPQPWGQIGQLLPPGAAGTLLRGTAYFDGAGTAGPAWTLAAWAAVGLALTLIARPKATPTPASAPSPRLRPRPGARARRLTRVPPPARPRPTAPGAACPPAAPRNLDDRAT